MGRSGRLLASTVHLLYRVTVPGVVLHELAHQFVAELFDLEVREVDYTSHVRHEAPRTLTGAVAVALAPLMVNTAFVVGVVSVAVGRVPVAVAELEATPVHAVAAFLAFALLFRAVPSTQDIGNVFGAARRGWRRRSAGTILLFVLLAPALVPLYAALWLARATDTRVVVDLGYAALGLALLLGAELPVAAVLRSLGT